MPRLRQDAKRRGRQYTDRHFRQLRTGHDFFHDCWGNGELSDEVEAEMLDCWRQHHVEIIAAHLAKWPCERPWFWWRVDSPEARDMTIPQAEQLRRLGLLSENEQDHLFHREIKQTALSEAYNPFRRPWSWWQRIASEPRNYFTPEARQLAEMGVLTADEQRYMDKPDETTAQIIRNRTALTDEEKLYLGLPY